MNIGMPVYEGDESYEDPDQPEDAPVEVPTVEPVPVPA